MYALPTSDDHTNRHHIKLLIIIAIGNRGPVLSLIFNRVKLLSFRLKTTPHNHSRVTGLSGSRQEQLGRGRRHTVCRHRRRWHSQFKLDKGQGEGIFLLFPTSFTLVSRCSKYSRPLRTAILWIVHDPTRESHISSAVPYLYPVSPYPSFGLVSLRPVAPDPFL